MQSIPSDPALNSSGLCTFAQIIFRMPEQLEPNPFEISFPAGELSPLFPTGRAARNLPGRVYLLVVLQGEAQVEIDGKHYVLHQKSFLFLTPGHLLLRLSQTGNFQFQHLSFHFDFLSDFPLLLKADICDHAGKMPCLPLDEAAFGLVKSYYDFIGNRYRESPNRLEVTKGLLFAFIVEVSRLYSGRNISVKASRRDELADGFFSLLHKHYKQERKATFYAEQLCVTDKYLMRSVKQQTGQTVHFWITDFILREAKLMLRSTDLTVTEITEKLNFPDSSFFARFFRKYTGISPLQFRKSE